MRTIESFSRLLLVGVALIGLAGQADATVGATTPFITYEGENGTVAGGAIVRSLSTPPTTQFSSPELEASGHAFVQLNATGQSVSWTNNTGQSITALNLRYSIPDSATGGGITSTLNLYVNGVFRQAVAVNSLQSWYYETASTYNAHDQNPSAGNPHVFYDETHFWISGAAIAPGSTITLKKDAANSAAFYDIDCIDLETPPVALTQPANSLSIVTYGAVANDITKDSTTAIQNCIIAAKTQGKSVWIPSGIFYLNSGSGLYADSVTISGAGMWYSTVYANVPAGKDGGNIILSYSCIHQNFALDSNIGSGTVGGGGINVKGSNWKVSNLWIQHLGAGVWANGDNGVVENCRTGCTWADGININNGNGAAGNNTGNNLIVRNNFIRGSGDDGIAINSGAAGSVQMNAPTVINNTVVAPWWANNMGIYGGKNIVVKDNLLLDSVKEYGLSIGTFGSGTDWASLEAGVVTGNVMIRCGSYGGYGFPYAGLGIGVGTTTPYVDSVYVGGNTVINPVFMGITLQNSSNMVIQNNTVTNPGTTGIVFSQSARGYGAFTANTVTGVQPGQQAFLNNGIGYGIYTPIQGASAKLLSSGLQLESCSEGGQSVGFIQNGSYAVYNQVNLNGINRFVARVASAGSGGNIQIHLDSPTGPLIGTCMVAVTGGWQTWADAYCPITGASGSHDVYLVFTGSSGNLFNFEFFSFSGTDPEIRASDFASSSSAIQTENCSEGGLNVAWISNGSYTSYNSLAWDGVKDIVLRVASGTTGGNIEVRLDSITGPLIATCPVPATNGWQNWITQRCAITPSTGTHNLYLVYSGGFNVQWFALSTGLPTFLSPPLRNQDIGAVQVSGEAYAITSEGYSVVGSGLGFTGTADSGHFAYTPMVGDGSITARIASQGATGALPLAGVMMRAGFHADAANCNMLVTPSQAVYQARGATGGSTTSTLATGSNQWVRIVRSNNVFTGYSSPDGISWTQVGTPQRIPLSDPIYVGLAVSSCDNTVTNTATFDNVSAPWTSPALTAPSGLSVTGTITAVALSWDAVSGATGYNVKRSLTSGSGYVVIADGVAGTSFSDSSVAPSTTYYYVVSALSPVNESVNSTEVSASPVVAPAAPTGLTATPGNNRVMLSWNASDSATSYTVWRWVTGDPGYTTLTTLTGTSYADISAVNGTAYYYIVTASNTAGTSTHPALAGQVAPSGFNATVGNAQVALAWTPSAYATSYNVKRSTSNGGPYTTIASLPSSVSTYLDINQTNGTPSYYVISLVNANGESVNSAQIAATPQLSTTACTINVQANGKYVTASGTSPLIADATAVGVNQIFAMIGVSGTQFALQSVASGQYVSVPGTAASLTANHSGIGNSELFTSGSLGVGKISLKSVGVDRYVCAEDAGNSPLIANRDSAGAWETFLLKVGGFSAAPLGLSASAANASVTLHWDATAGATAYSVKRAATSGGPFTEIATPSANRYTDPGISGVACYYVVSAVAADGGSPNSTEVSATPQIGATPFAPPTITSGLSATGSIGSAFTYQITASNSPTSYTASGLPTGLSVSATSGVISGNLVSTGTSSITINAINISGTGSATLILTVLPLPPLAPASLIATGSNALVSLSWVASTGATSYNVKRSLTDGSGYITLINTAATNYNDASVANWTTYYYVVSAVNAGGESNNSAQADVTPQSPPISTAEKSMSSEISLSAGTGSMTFMSSVSGHTYQLQFVDSLTNGTWQNFGAPQIGTGENLQFSIPIDPSVPRRFFRFQIQQ